MQLHHVTSQPATYSDIPCLGTYLQWDQVRRELCQAERSSHLPPVGSQIWKCLGGDTTRHHSIKMSLYYIYIQNYIQTTSVFKLKPTLPPGFILTLMDLTSTDVTLCWPLVDSFIDFHQALFLPLWHVAPCGGSHICCTSPCPPTNRWENKILRDGWQTASHKRWSRIWWVESRLLW